MKTLNNDWTTRIKADYYLRKHVQKHRELQATRLAFFEALLMTIILIGFVAMTLNLLGK